MGSRLNRPVSAFAMQNTFEVLSKNDNRQRMFARAPHLRCADTYIPIFARGAIGEMHPQLTVTFLQTHSKARMGIANPFSFRRAVSLKATALRCSLNTFSETII